MIESVNIEGLFGRHNVEIPIQKNRLIIVGPNGYGKSTILNCIYYLMTKQFQKLGNLPFEAIHVSASSGNFSLTRENAKYAQRAARFDRFRMEVEKSSVATKISDHSIGDDEIARELASSMRVPRHRIADLVHRYRESLNEADFFIPHKQVDDLSLGHSLYLPTYRRIERELWEVLNIPEDEVRRLQRERAMQHPDSGPYLELVQFGMEDVKRLFSVSLEKAKSISNRLLGELAAKHLSDVINFRADKDSGLGRYLRQLQEQTLLDALENVDESILGDRDKRALISRVDELKQKNKQRLNKSDKDLLQYVRSLINTLSQITDQYSNISSLVSVVNNYLEPSKKVVFDEPNFDIFVINNFGEKIDISHLSSGEKQIVSLFSHIILGVHKNFSAFIDEPELSISVAWQKRMLPDLLNCGSCSLLVAVTHSPFIWDNELECHAVDVRSFMNA